MGQGRAWAHRLKWNKLGCGLGAKSFSDCSKPSPFPRASSGRRDTNLLPKMILLNAHTTFILGCEFNPASEEMTMLLGHGGLATSPQHSRGDRPWVGSASPGPHHTSGPIPCLQGWGGMGRFPFPSWAQGSAQDGWADLELVLKHLRGLGVPACPDIPRLPTPPQQPERPPGLRATCPRGLCRTQAGALCWASSSSHPHARVPQGPPSRPQGPSDGDKAPRG